MRPRPDAAENDAHPVEQADLRIASMRPRPDAAENKEKALEERLAAEELQ